MGVNNTYGYDANGNQATRAINGVTLTLAYDAEGRMVSVTGPSLTATFTYDGDRKRVAQTINGVATYFIGNYYEKQGSTVTKYYFAGSQRLAMREGNALYYLLSDHLGSTSLTTDSNGNIVSEMRYSAWGGVRYSSGSIPTDYTYTGQYNDSALGLMDYVARRYDPAIGRFISPDSIVPVASQGVQGYDRYAYSNNNPVRYIDPSGHWIESALDVAFIAYDIYDISANGLNWENGLSLAADVVGLALPVVTGGGMAVRALTHADDAVKVINTADNIIDAANAIDNAIDAGNAADNLTDIVKAFDDIPCSFSAETDITTPEGTQDIAAIEIGDFVLAWNEADGTLGYYAVTDVLVHADPVLTELIIDGEWIETTPDHPFYVEGKGWTSAEALEWNDEIRQADGDTGTLWLKWTVHRKQEMYNLTVETAHTFFIGDGQWLVHNTCPINPPSYRGGLKSAMERMGNNVPTGMLSPQVHHDLPWDFRDWFAGPGRGINVNDPQFGRWVSGSPNGPHQKWSYKYTQAWRSFIRENPNAARQEVLDYLKELLDSGKYPSR